MNKPCAFILGFYYSYLSCYVTGDWLLSPPPLKVSFLLCQTVLSLCAIIQIARLCCWSCLKLVQLRQRTSRTRSSEWRCSCSCCMRQIRWLRLQTLAQPNDPIFVWNFVHCDDNSNHNTIPALLMLRNILVLRNLGWSPNLQWENDELGEPPTRQLGNNVCLRASSALHSQIVSGLRYFPPLRPFIKRALNQDIVVKTCSASS